MKRSRVIALTMAGISLSLTGCRRSTGENPGTGNTSIMPPSQLDPQLRSSLPPFVAGSNLSGVTPPQNAYDEHLGYYHDSCSGWFPYPYNYYDSRYGYYRCGRWYKDRSTTPRTHHTHGIGHRPWMAGTPRTDTADPQPQGAPTHDGIPHASASSARSAATTTTSRGGFGSTGHSSSGFSAHS